MSSKKYADGITQAMNEAIKDKNTIIIGQGVSDYKGIFGTTLEAQKICKDRVVETPIAEESVTGICIGLALNGMYPINTHIRSDFVLLAFNQIVNHAAKYKYMFGGIFNVPMMIRMVIGRSWGQGAQHSQSIQSMLAHVPGLVVVMPSSPSSIISSYRYAREIHKGPVIMIEHRLMYDIEFQEINEGDLTIFGSRIVRTGEDVTIVATSIMVVEAKRAAKLLEKYNISLEIIDMHSISHPDVEMIKNSVKKTGRLIVADTSWKKYGVCSEVIRIVSEDETVKLKSSPITLGMADAPCPTAKALEDNYYPEVSDIIASVLKIAGKEEELKHIIPERNSMRDYYKEFKGPF